MTDKNRAVAGTVVAVSMLLGTGIKPAATERLALALHLDDRAAVASPHMAEARIEIERVFRDAGVAIEWAERRAADSGAAPGTGGQARRVSVMLIDTRRAAAPNEAGCVLGFAAPRQGMAFVFYNRVLDTSNVRPVDPGVVLARVIAHEIGHLLLPRGAHSPHGIMRATLDFGFSNPNRFTGDQARAIRARLAERLTNEDARD